MRDFRNLRRLGGLTQFEVAAKAHIAPATLSRIEAGLTSGSPDQRRRILTVVLPVLEARLSSIQSALASAGSPAGA